MQRQPQLTTSWVQRFGLPIYATSVGDNDWDFAVPVLRQGGVDPAQAKLIAADGNRSAYDRIRKGDQYQTVTVSEPIELQAWQAIDELNRAFHGEAPSGYVQPPFLVTRRTSIPRGRQEHLDPKQQLQGSLSCDLGRHVTRRIPGGAAAGDVSRHASGRREWNARNRCS
jgi:ribose transport system substrate-binding protein